MLRCNLQITAPSRALAFGRFGLIYWPGGVFSPRTQIGILGVFPTLSIGLGFCGEPPGFFKNGDRMYPSTEQAFVPGLLSGVSVVVY